ncbi:hypothetical protein NHQ30_002816 [Ciborinia camelliae]|nr:hypothetical protein NHQ30_002816 [Ciborinia camelliae]
MNEDRVTTRRRKLPRQRVRETRWTNLKSKQVLTSLPFPIKLSKGRQSPPRSWNVVEDLTNEEDKPHSMPIRIKSNTFTRKLMLGNQKRSPFLRLPPEIRAQIYDLLLPPHQYILVNYRHHEHRWRQQNHIRYKQYTKGGIFYQKKLPVTRLWLVSRQLYHDTRYFANSGWSLNTFGFKNRWVPAEFVRSLSLQQRHAIKNVCFADSYSARKILRTTRRTLSGLERIVIRDVTAHTFRTLSQNRKIQRRRARFESMIQGSDSHRQILNFKYLPGEEMDAGFFEQCSMDTRLGVKTYLLNIFEHDLCYDIEWTARNRDWRMLI